MVNTNDIVLKAQNPIYNIKATLHIAIHTVNMTKTIQVRLLATNMTYFYIWSNSLWHYDTNSVFLAGLLAAIVVF